RGDPEPPEAAEYVITIGGRVLMNGAAHRSEDALAELACRPLAEMTEITEMAEIVERARSHPPRVLLGGLGMGYTLRAALDVLPRTARVRVAEIDPVIVRWCRGALAPVTGNAVGDPRVTVEVADVAAVLARAARSPEERYDAIILDLYEGPREAHGGRDDPLWGERALATARAALVPRRLPAAWAEGHPPGFAT